MPIEKVKRYNFMIDEKTERAIKILRFYDVPVSEFLRRSLLDKAKEIEMKEVAEGRAWRYEKKE